MALARARSHWSSALAVVAATLVAIASPARAQQARVDRLEIVVAGFYTAEDTGKTNTAPGSVTGYWKELGNVRFLKEAPEVTNTVGTAFGVRFRIIGRRQDAEVALRSVWKIPPPGITNPDNGNTYRQSVSDFTSRIGTIHMRGYSFDNPWEIVAGVWVLEIWQDDRKLLEKSFTIQGP